jgi:hypothetical protein
MGEFILRDDLELNEGPHGAKPAQGRKGKLAFIESDDEEEGSDDEIIEPNAPMPDGTAAEGETKTKLVEKVKQRIGKIAPQQRNLDMPDSDSESADLNEEELQKALNDL